MVNISKIYTISSFILSIVPLILLNYNIIKYKIFNPTAEMKRNAFIKNVNDNGYININNCYPINKHCYEVINGYKYLSFGERQCTLDDWDTASAINCNIFPFDDWIYFIMIISYCNNIIIIITLRCLSLDTNDCKFISILCNISCVFNLVINIFIINNKFTELYLTLMILNILFVPLTSILACWYISCGFNIKDCCNQNNQDTNSTSQRVLTLRVLTQQVQPQRNQPQRVLTQRVQPIIDMVRLSRRIQPYIVRPQENNSENNICLVCYDNKRNILFSPCNHLCCCNICSNNFTTCPYCRIVIENKTTIYIP